MVKTAHYKLLLQLEKEELSPEALAKKLGVHVNTIKKYLRLLERRSCENSWA